MVNPMRRIGAVNSRATKLKHRSNKLLSEGMDLLSDVQAARARNYVRQLRRGKGK